MKQNYIYTLLLCFATLLAACSHEGETVKLSADPSSITIPAQVQNTYVFTVTAPTEWSISKPADANWIVIEPSKGSGITTVTVTAANNLMTNSRSTILKITSKTTNESKNVTVTQEGLPVQPPPTAAKITGNTSNNCPYTATVELSTTPINTATSYKWYCNGEAAATTTEPVYAASKTGAYTVAGVNDAGEGTPSTEKRITITACPLPDAAGSITGVSINTCPDETILLSIAPINNAVSYQWYNNGTAIAGASAASYDATITGVYTVAGVNAAGEGIQSPQKAITIVECPSMVDDYLGDWNVEFEVLVQGSPSSMTPNYTQGTFTHTVTITKVNSRTVKIVGIQTTGKDEVIATVNENKEMTIGTQKLTTSWNSTVDTYLAPMIAEPPCGNMGQSSTPVAIQTIDGKPTIELKAANPGYTKIYNGVSYTASYTVLPVTTGTTNCLGYFLYAIGTKWVKKTDNP